VTTPRHQLDRARRRVHTLLGLLAEFESRPACDPVLLAAAHRGLRQASRDLSDAVYAMLNSSALAGGIGPSDLVLDRLPALERWRRLAIASPGRRAPLDVAAAHELTGLKLSLAGDLAGADEAFTAALGVAETKAAS